MVKISKNPGQCAGKKLFFFIQKITKIQDNVNPGHCEIQYLLLKIIIKTKNNYYLNLFII
jgi:hypothetical protein